MILLILIILIVVQNDRNSLYKNYYNDMIEDNIKKMKSVYIDTSYQKDKIYIPKIIHKIAPADKSKWRDVWITSHNSWLKYYKEPEYKIMMWNDEEDINNFIKNKYSWFYSIYCNYPHKIQRIDMVRYFIIYEYGGIYADMDYECFKNFYDELPSDKISIVEAFHSNTIIRRFNFFLENSLIASPKYNNFWLDVILLATQRLYNKIIPKELYIVYSTGPELITNVYQKYKKYKKKINILNKKYYNNGKKIYSIGAHYHTSVWLHPMILFIQNKIYKNKNKL